MNTRIALVLLMAACVDAQNGASEKPRNWGPASGPYQLSISSSKNQYEPGERIEITSVLRNSGDRAIMLLRTTPETNYLMEVLTPAESWLPWRPRAALTPYGRRVKSPEINNVAGTDIPPGREVEDTFEVNKIYEMSAPGEYTITFQCRQPTVSIADKAPKRPMVDVTSNRVTVTVLPKRQ